MGTRSQAIPPDVSYETLIFISSPPLTTQTHTHKIHTFRAKLVEWICLDSWSRHYSLMKFGYESPSLEVFRRRGLTFIRHLIPGGERERSVCRLTISRGGFALTTPSVKHLIFLLTRRPLTLGRPIICLKSWLYWKCSAPDILSDFVPSTFKLPPSEQFVF